MTTNGTEREVVTDGRCVMGPEVDKPAKERVQSINLDDELLDGYEPEKSDVVATRCPACNAEIVVYQDGSIGQRRTRPIPKHMFVAAGTFERHDCPAKPGLYACAECGDRYDDPQDAKHCCRLRSEDLPVMYYRVLGAKSLGDNDG